MTKSHKYYRVSFEEFNIFLKNPKSIVTYNDGMEAGTYKNIKIYIQDSENCSKFYFTEKNYRKEIGIISLDYENNKIIVLKYPFAGTYVAVFIIFVIFIWYGVVKVINNINNLKGKWIY